jgi:serine/threonine-protein kinase HipA
LEGVGQPVGLLEGLVGIGGHRVRFTYTKGYRGPSLSVAMPPSAEPYEDSVARTFFDNILPEGPVRRGTADTDNRPIDEDDVVGLLSVLGGECPGAVMVLSQGSQPSKAPGSLSTDYNLLSDDDLAKSLRAIAAGRQPGELERASLAGVQAKIALACHLDSGIFLQPRSKTVPTTHLVKVGPASDPRFDGVVANEILCMRVAGSLGLPVAEVDRFSVDGMDALLVRRYDRVVSDDEWVARLHQEDATQALGLDRTLKYEQQAAKAGRAAGLPELLGTFSALTASPAETRDILRRAVFANWLLGNNDAHMKNFSLLHPTAGGRPRLAPLYDIVSTESLPGGWTTMAMTMNGALTGPAVDGSCIEWLAGLDAANRKPAATVVRRRMVRFRDMAAQVLAAVDTVVSDDDVTEVEADPTRALVAGRLATLNRDLSWGVPTPPLGASHSRR